MGIVCKSTGALRVCSTNQTFSNTQSVMPFFSPVPYCNVCLVRYCCFYCCYCNFIKMHPSTHFFLVAYQFPILLKQKKKKWTTIFSLCSITATSNIQQFQHFHTSYMHTRELGTHARFQFELELALSLFNQNGIY